MNPTNHPGFDGGEMPASWPGASIHDDLSTTDHRSGAVDPGDYQFWCGCYFNQKGNLYSASKRIVWGWTDGTDEPNFAWIVELNDGRFACVEGGHDYTGWDCQSSLEVCAVETTAVEAAKFLTDDPRRIFSADQVAP